jgi:hypothetical protein
MQVLPEPRAGSRLVWDIDVLPHELAKPIAALVEEGAAAMRRALAMTSSRAPSSSSGSRR